MIRPASLDDLQELHQLQQACAYHPWSMGALREALLQQHTTAWIFSTTGYCIERVINLESEILDLGIHPDARRQGLARQLLQQMLDGWRLQGVVAIWLEVREANLAARRLYNDLGWSEMNRRANYYGPDEHAICMQLTP